MQYIFYSCFRYLILLGLNVKDCEWEAQETAELSIYSSTYSCVHLFFWGGGEGSIDLFDAKRPSVDTEPLSVFGKTASM